MVLSALAPSVAGWYRSDSGLSARIVSPRSWVARQHFRTTTWMIVPIWQFSAAYPAGHPLERDDDGLGEELRVLLAHSTRGHHTANVRRHGPPGPSGEKRLGRGLLMGLA